MSCVIGVVVSSMRARTRSPVWVLPMIVNWLDDHSRFLISCTAHRPVTGDDVVTTFLTAIDKHGTPVSTLTDNGLVYETWQSDFTHRRRRMPYWAAASVTVSWWATILAITT